eukprot:GSChrysophyteH1.ASY1.ANO1.2221.1 assembled CDS
MIEVLKNFINFGESEGSLGWWLWNLSVIFIMWVFMRFSWKVISRFMGWDLEYEMKKLTTTSVVDPYNNGVRYAISCWCDIGKRPYQEDRHQELRGTSKHPDIGDDCSLYGIFDGHGGYRASQYCKERLLQHIVASKHFPSRMTDAIKAAFYQTDAEFSANAKMRYLNDGSTALVVAINKRILYVGNAGDCRAILIKKPSTPLPLTGNTYQDKQNMYETDVEVLTSDHKPNRPDEEQRIKKLGGRVVHWGRWRVEGVLAVSRAIGDIALQPYVTCDPELTMRPLVDGVDLLLLIASDGVWDVLSNEDAARCVMQAVLTKPWAQVAHELCDEAKIRGSQDNITAQVVDLCGMFCPKPGNVDLSSYSSSN